MRAPPHYSRPGVAQGKEAGGDGERGAPSPEADDAGSAQHHFMYKMRQAPNERASEQPATP
jgi:hypothetical protein